MRYAISYVSNANPSVSLNDVQDLMLNICEFNNAHDITGLLLFSGNQFFQFLEGEKGKIMDLFTKIETDPRHHNVIKLIEKKVFIRSYSGYMCDFITDNSRYTDFKIQNYLNHIKTLNPSARKSVTRIIETIIE